MESIYTRAAFVSRLVAVVYVHVWGEKLRDCRAILNSLESFTLRDGVRYDAREERESGDTANRPVGKVDLGVCGEYSQSTKRPA